MSSTVGVDNEKGPLVWPPQIVGLVGSSDNKDPNKAPPECRKPPCNLKGDDGSIGIYYDPPNFKGFIPKP